MKRLLLFVLIIMGFCGRFASDAKRCPVAQAVVEPVEPLLVRPVQDDMQCRLWVDSVLDRLSLKERVGQLFIYTIAPHQDKSNRELLRKVIEDYKVGGLLFSGGLMQNQVMLTNEAQRMADIPLLITFDGEWGLSMRLRDTPAFPKNMVLGCIQNDSLLYEYGREMARQCKELGVQVNFAPVADVNINPKNPVINTRSFGEDPVNVANKVIAYARGLEDGGVLSVAKHFPGHGDTDVDSHKALPVLTFTRERLDSVELYPFKKVIEEGLGGIMVGHLEVPAFEKEPGLPSSLSRKVVYDLLMRELKFRGLVFTDALAMKGVSNNGSLCLKALKAGHDLLLVPRRIKEEVAAVLAAVKRGELSEQAIEEKCRKVLTYKYALGLNKKPMVRLSGLDMRINTPYTRDLIRRLKVAAITVLSNPTEVLPLDPDIKDVAVLNVGTAAVVGTMFLITRIWDSAFDPIVGVIADRTHSRWGKFRPYLLWLAVPFGIIGVLTFVTPDWSPTGKLVYAYVTYSLMMMIYSAINVPYASLLGVMSPNPKERNTLSTYRMTFAYIGSFIALLLFMPLVNFFSGNSKDLGDQQTGWTMAVVVIATLCIILFFGCFAWTKERVKPIKEAQNPLKEDLKDLFKNKPWWILLGAGVAALVFNSIRDGATVYYFKYFVVEEDYATVSFFGMSFVLSGLYLALGQAANIIGVIAAAPVSNRIGKRNTYMWAMIIATVLSVIFYWFDKEDLIWMFVFQALISICAGSIFPLLWSMYADCADYSELKTGNRATGLIFSSSSMSQKFGWAIGTAITGWLLGFFGFQANAVQSEEAISGIKMFLSFLPAVGTILSVVFISMYPLTEKKMKDITTELECKR